MTDFASVLASSRPSSAQMRMPAKPLTFKSFAGTRDHRRLPPHTPLGQFTRRRSQVRVLSRPPLAEKVDADVSAASSAVCLSRPACSVSDSELRDTYSPVAIDIAPATSAATPTSTSLFLV